MATQQSRPRTTKPTSASRASRSTSRPRSAAPKPAADNGPARAATTASKLRGPAIAGGAAIAGIIGGIALGAKARQPRRRRLPSLDGLDIGKLDMKKTAKQVGRASKQFGELTRELRKAGEQAERIGDALS